MKWSRLVSPALWTLDNHSFGFQVFPSHTESEDHNSQRIQWWPVSRHGDVTLMSDNWHRIHHQVCWIITTPSITVPLGLLPGAGEPVWHQMYATSQFFNVCKTTQPVPGSVPLEFFIYSNSQKRIGRYFQDSLLLMYFYVFFIFPAVQSFSIFHFRHCYMAVCQNLGPLVNIKIAGKWMFIPLKMVLIGIDPYSIDGTPSTPNSWLQPPSAKTLQVSLRRWVHWMRPATFCDAIRCNGDGDPAVITENRYSLVIKHGWEIPYP